MMDEPDVLGPSELAALLELSRQRAWVVSGQDGFPPFRQLEIGRVWDARAVRAWKADHDATDPARVRRTAVLDAYRTTGSVAGTARAVGCHITTVRRILRALGEPLPADRDRDSGGDGH